MKKYQRKIETILRHIDELEKELFSTYESKEILDVIENMHDKAYKYYGMSDGLLSVIYDGVYNDVKTDEFINNTYKDAFIKYEKIRESGKYNMITEAFLAAKEAGLSMEEYTAVLKNYKVLKEQFSI